MMAVSLFTFRELLKLLGVEDYGTYNVVAGIVILFSFLSNALTQSNQRFLSYHLGKGDKAELQRTFSMIINVQLMFSVLILILAETIGLWFLNTQMNFGTENISVVNWVYQFTILTFIFQIMQIPFKSAIISYERMNFFSYSSIGEAFLRLSIVLMLGLFGQGRLIIYSALLTFSAILMFFVYWLYVVSKFKGCKYRLFYEKKLLKGIIGFSGWNMIGGLGNVGASQGLNMLYNIFCGVVVNAAMGVSNQVGAAVNSLVGNIQTAFNPQIVKSYASGNIDYFNSLVFRASRISFILISVVGFPIIFCCKDILSLWLTAVPEYAVPFAQLTMVYCMIDSLSGSLWTANQAHGNIKVYMIVVASLTLLNIPISFILLYIGFSPVWAMFARVVITFIILNFRILYIGKKIKFPVVQYYRNVVLKAAVVAVLSSLGAVITSHYVLLSGFMQLILQGGCIFIITAIISAYLMLQANEREFCVNKIMQFVPKCR